MIAVLTVPDEVVIGFFTAVIIAQATANTFLWKANNELWKTIVELLKQPPKPD